MTQAGKGSKPRMGSLYFSAAEEAGRLTKAGSSATMVPREEVMPHLKRVVQVYQQGAKPGMRMREFINSIGFEEFQKRVSQLLEVSPNG